MSDQWAQSETERIVANLIRIGIIAELDEENARVTVHVGGLTTDWLPWLTQRAGLDRTWWAPEPGEQVLVLSPYGDPAQAVVLPAIYQEASPAPADVRTTSRTEFEDGAVIEYDRAGSHYLVEVPSDGSITLRIGDTTLVLQGDRTTLTTPHLAVESPITSFSGDVAVGGDVTAGAVSLRGHTHPDPQGGATSAPNG